MTTKQNGFIKFLAVSIVYIGFAIYLYLPYWRTFKGFELLLPFSCTLSAIGCFLLSRRWVDSITGSFFAGTIYGFGPFMLGLGKFHPTAPLLAALIPWLFLPAAFGLKTKLKPLRILLCGLPFLAIIAFFHIGDRLRLFAVPLQTKLHLSDLAGLFAPLVMAKKDATLIGFYHVSIVALAVGIFMLLAARRLGVIAVFLVGLVLAFCNSFLNISPIIWLVFPTLCCSILIAEGINGLATAGFADRKWVLGSFITTEALAIVTLLLATKYFKVFAGFADGYARLFVQAAKMYILGTIATAIIFFMTRAQLRFRWLRLTLLSVCLAVDIFLGAQFIVEKIL